MADIPLFKRNFPLQSCHLGAALGNGRMGLLVWGGENILRLTVGRADFWDHRGGMAWSEKQSFAAVSEILRSKTPERIDELFPIVKEEPATPSVLPLGRVQLTLPSGCLLESYSLEQATGKLQIFYRRKRKLSAMTCYAGVESDETFALSDVPDGTAFEVIPAWDLSDALKKRNIAPPLKEGEKFLQTLPDDAPCGIEFRKVKNELQARSFREESPPWRSLEELEEENLVFWGDFWKNAPRITTGNRSLDEHYYASLFKFGCACCHKSVPPGLQGSWIEDDALPPWGADYHFNINVQMFYMGAFAAGKSDTLLPLFRMIGRWKEVLSHNARCFAGTDGFMLPHAVDDRCRCMGNFWSGAVDHGCTIWMAQMMFQYVKYTRDLDFLREFAFEFMKKTMAVCVSMMERNGNDLLRLPFGVSPEYRGNAHNAWGANPSFQLAAIHNLAQNLIAASALLNEKCEELWLEIEHALPQAAVCRTARGEEIGLWEGTCLEESHRHHSHLAGVFPFDTLDPEHPGWQKIFDNTLTRWSEKGMGCWTNWALAWGSMLYSRFNNPDMAELCLDLQRKFFTNPGGSSMHDSLNKGFSVINFGQGREIMQLDGALGSISAVQDMFFFESQGVFKLFYGVPASWKKSEFRNLAAPGKIRISGEMQNGVTKRIELVSETECSVTIALPDGERFFGGNSKTTTIELKPGTLCRLTCNRGILYEQI